MINTEQTNIKKNKNSKDVVGIKCYFSATGVRQWLSIIWSRSSGFIHIERTTPREAITWLQSCSLIVPLSWPSEPSGQNLKSNLLTATWWLGQYTTGRCRTVWPSLGCCGGRLAWVTQCSKGVMLQLQLVTCPEFFFSVAVESEQNVPALSCKNKLLQCTVTE